MAQLTTVEKKHYERALAEVGIRSTRQREHVYSVILEKRDHPTADELYARARSGMPTISLATVYNCLETLVQAHLVRQVNLERGATRFCPNQTEHAHFHCQKTGQVIDVPIPGPVFENLKSLLPPELVAEHLDLSFSGHSNVTHDGSGTRAHPNHSA